MVDQSINKKPSAYRQGVLYLYPENVAAVSPAVASERH